ncbi:MAG: hypothetical protein ACQETL_08615 [Bacteroidota bacterium]
MNSTSKSVRKIGKINTITDGVKQGEGSLIAKNMLDEMVKEFARYSANFIDKVYEAPFIYKEKQLNSILAPAFANVSDAFLLEHPITREWALHKKDQSLPHIGWVDYWVRNKDFDYYIELKHGYDTYQTETVRKKSVDNWQFMNNSQLKNIQKEVKNWSSEMNGAFLISLHIITIYDYGKYAGMDWESYPEDELKWIQKNYFNNFKKPSPNWSALWMLHDNLVQNSAWEEETHCEFYPGVLFLSKIKKL